LSFEPLLRRRWWSADELGVPMGMACPGRGRRGPGPCLPSVACLCGGHAPLVGESG
jgi:hypothetical protein